VGKFPMILLQYRHYHGVVVRGAIPQEVFLKYPSLLTAPRNPFSLSTPKPIREALAPSNKTQPRIRASIDGARISLTW
jgi:hypothetical protein